jgi:UDP-N-acetyl-D-glucosamine dehydrogenase
MVRKRLEGWQTETLDQALERARKKTAKVGVIGLGYAGLPVALAFASAGFRTTGFDIDDEKVEKLRRGENYIHHLSIPAVSKMVEHGRLAATSDFGALSEMDAVIICVPTPLTGHFEPDLSFVRNTAKTVAARLRRGQLVILQSTSFPGTTEEVVLPILEESGLRCPAKLYHISGDCIDADEGWDPDFFLAFAPEREDPGNSEYRSHHIPKVIGGLNAASARAARGLLAEVYERTVVVSSAKSAEMTKLLENVFRCVNIALVNELKLLSLRMGIDIWEVIEAAKTKPFGFMPFYPGPGLGGHCIPIDPFYLSWKARQYGFHTRFVELAGEINSTMPEHVITSIANALNGFERSLRGARILILGISYKKDVDDLRESPALRIIELLRSQGTFVDYHDPHFPRLPKTRRYDFHLESVDLSPENLSDYDAVVIVTDHSCFDYPMIVRYAQLVIDSRNATRLVRENRQKIVRC